MDTANRGKAFERSGAVLTLTEELARAHKLMTLRQTAVMQKYGLTARQAMVISILADRPDGLISQKALEEQLGLTNPTVTVLVQNMIKKGFIHKEKVPWDGRKYRLSLTPKARRIKEEALQDAEEMNRRFYDGISEEDRELLARVLGKILDNVDKM